MISLSGFSAYLLENGYAANTLACYLRALRDYAEYNDGKEPDGESVAAWKKQLCERCKPQTVNLKLAAISRYCEYAGICISIRRIKMQARTCVEYMISAAEVDRLTGGLDADGKQRDAVIVRLMAKTGARISEIIRMRKADLMRGYVDMQSKGKLRRIYFPRALTAELAAYAEPLRPGDYLCKKSNGNPLTVSAVQKMLKAAAAKYGIPAEHVHPHAFRHFFAVEFLRRNPNPSLLADILGHSSINTTMIYLRLTKERQQEEIDRTVDW